jgi:DNA-binding transcriptional ArsR family regulator
VVHHKRRDVAFRAIADPTGREILSLLRGRRRTVGEIAGNLRVSRPAIWKHLRLLRAAGMVVTRKHGAPLRLERQTPAGDRRLAPEL